MKTCKVVSPMNAEMLEGFQAVRCEQICLAAGARFLGIQKANPEQSLEALCMFADLHGSCLAVKMSEVSVEAVRLALTESEGRWNARRRVQT